MKVSKNANEKEIKKSFNKLALDLHPDKNKDDPQANEKFQQLSKAKSILLDPESREKYDRYGITDEQDEVKMNNEMMQEMMMKQRLREVIQVGISLTEVLNGFKKKLNLQREVINSAQRKQYTENFEITLEVDSTKPINKPIVFGGKGKKYDDLTGDLIIMLNIKPDNTYKLNKSNFNLITKQKISIAQSLCGFEINLPYGGKNIMIQYDKLINPTNPYILKGKGVTITDEAGNLTKSDIEVHFDIEYQKQLTSEQVKVLKEVFKYDFTKSTPSSNTNIHTMVEHVLDKDSDEDQNQTEMFEQIFSGGGFPFGGGMGGMPGMRGGTTRVFTSGGPQMGGMRGMSGMPGMPGMEGNAQECHVQ